MLGKKVEHAKGATSDVQDAPAWSDAESAEQLLRLTFETISLAKKTIPLVRDLSTENVWIRTSHGYLPTETVCTAANRAIPLRPLCAHSLQSGGAAPPKILCGWAATGRKVGPPGLQWV